MPQVVPRRAPGDPQDTPKLPGHSQTPDAKIEEQKNSDLKAAESFTREASQSLKKAGDQENADNSDDPHRQKDDQQDQGENKEDESKQDQQDKGQTYSEDSDEEKKGEQPKPRENKLSPEEAQKLLNALNQQEDKVQDKMKKHKLKGAKVKIEKDW